MKYGFAFSKGTDYGNLKMVDLNRIFVFGDCFVLGF